MELPTPEAVRKDLRDIGVRGLRKALATELPGLSRLPSIRRAANAGASQRDQAIERLLRLGLAQLDDRLAEAGELYLLSRHDHDTRKADAAKVWSITEKSFEGRRLRELEPLLVRALISLAEQEQSTGATEIDDVMVAPEDEPPRHELFAACAEGEEFKDRELAAVAARNTEVWWHEPSSDWFGSYFAFWYKDETIPCGRVKLISDQGSYGARRFSRSPALDGPSDKLTIVSASWINSDADEHEIHCGLTNYGFAFQWAKDHATELLMGRSSPSVFGASDRLAYPGIAGVHTLMRTSDGYLLFGLRGLKTVTYHQLTWSASFEESVSPAKRDGTGDKTVLDTIVRGLHEEWGIPATAVAESTTLAIGREFVRMDDTRLDLSASILVAIQLGIDLATVWKRLDQRSKIVDIDEHCAWAAVRFQSRAEILQLLRFGRDRTQGQDLFHEFGRARPAFGEIAFYPGGPDTGLEDHGLMPTSAARLYLGSRWLARY